MSGASVGVIFRHRRNPDALVGEEEGRLNPIRSARDLPERPECDDLMLQFHGFEEIEGTVQASAIQRALAAHYRLPNTDLAWTEDDRRDGRLAALLSALKGYVLEHGEPVVTRVPPAGTSTFGTIAFTARKA